MPGIAWVRTPGKITAYNNQHGWIKDQLGITEFYWSNTLGALNPAMLLTKGKVPHIRGITKTFSVTRTACHLVQLLTPCIKQ